MSAKTPRQALPAPVRVRVQRACRIVGLPSAKLLLAEVEAGRAPIRVARLGARGIVHVHLADVVTYARQLGGSNP